MRTLVILNHDLSADQIAELGGEIETLSPMEKHIWGQVPAEGTIEQVCEHLSPILDRLPGFDRVVCQGEFTAFVCVLDECRELGIPVLVACSRRETVETVDASGASTKTAVFRHVQFRVVQP